MIPWERTFFFFFFMSRLIYNFTRLNDPLEQARGEVLHPTGDPEKDLQDAIRIAWGTGAHGKALTPKKDLVLIYRHPREAYAVFRTVHKEVP